MNDLNTEVNYYPHLFVVEKREGIFIFKTFLFPIRKVEDLSCLDNMRLLARFNNASILSSVMSEANGKIINSLLELNKEDSNATNKLLLKIVDNFGVIKI